MMLPRNKKPSAAQLERMIRQGQQAFRLKLAGKYTETAAKLQAAYRKALESVPNTGQGQAFATGWVDQVREALSGFEKMIGQQGAALQRDGIQNGRGFANSTLKNMIGTGFNTPSVESIQAMIRYADQLKLKLAKYGEYHADKVASIISAAQSLGKNPRETARLVNEYLRGSGGQPLQDALRMVRTVQLYSARSGTAQIYQANRDVLGGWWWSSSRDARTCMSCLAQHGKQFTLDETLNDHHNGRCAMIPIVKDWGNGISNPDVQTGEEWFGGLASDQQQKMMGQARWLAWQDGAFNFEQLSTTYHDGMYGVMRREASLQELIGAAAADYKKKAG